MDLRLQVCCCTGHAFAVKTECQAYDDRVTTNATVALRHNSRKMHYSFISWHSCSRSTV